MTWNLQGSNDFASTLVRTHRFLVLKPSVFRDSELPQRTTQKPMLQRGNKILRTEVLHHGGDS